MNKKPVSRAKELEAELIANEAQKTQAIDSGRVTTPTTFSTHAAEQNRIFQIKQGVRRRHPSRLLQNSTTIVDGTDNADTAIERAFLHEQERQDVPEGYRPEREDMLANQFGLVTTALDNYTKSKFKLVRMHPVGF